MPIRLLGSALVHGDGFDRSEVSYDGRVGKFPADSAAGLALPASTDKPVTVTGIIVEGVKNADAAKVDHRVDYWAERFYGQVDPMVTLSTIAEQLYGDPDALLFTRFGTGGFRYGIRFVGPNGITVLFGELPSDLAKGGVEIPFVEIQIKGEGFDWVHDHELRDLCWAMERVGYENRKCLHIDFAWDHVPFTPVDVRNACLNGDVRTFAQRWTGLAGEGGAIGDRDESSSTVYIGNWRQSPRALRVYDRKGFTRCEMVLRRERAHLAFERVIMGNDERCESPSGEVGARSLLVDFVNFIDRASASNIGRCPLLSWWGSFVEGARRTRLIIPRVVKSAKQVADWFERKLSRSLAVSLTYVQSRGESVQSYLRFMAESGLERLGGVQRQMVAELDPLVWDAWRGRRLK